MPASPDSREDGESASADESPHTRNTSYAGGRMKRLDREDRAVQRTATLARGRPLEVAS